MDNYIYTDLGSREVNEDSSGLIQLSDQEWLYIVCDGLGGHGRGEVASQLVVDAVISNAVGMKDSTDNKLVESLLYAQDLLLSEQKVQDAVDEMKTTVVALDIVKDKAQWIHVGDSRLYMWRNSKLMIRTLDHSVPQMLVATGEIKEKQIRHHEDRNRLIRVVGTKWETPKYELSEIVDVQKGDAFLMCTDGFWELITEKEMTKLLKKSKSAEEWVEKMSEIVNKRGKGTSMDNNTAIGVII